MYILGAVHRGNTAILIVKAASLASIVSVGRKSVLSASRAFFLVNLMLLNAKNVKKGRSLMPRVLPNVKYARQGNIQ